MHIRGVLLAGLIVIAGCSKDHEAEPRPDPAARGSGAAKPEPEGLQLVRAPEGVAHRVTSKVAIVIAKDGSLSATKLEGAVLGGFAAADLKGEPVAQVADLAAAVTALTPPPPPAPSFDDTADVGIAMTLDEGKMGKKDSDRAEGSYRMKTNDQAREEAIAAAKAAGILGAASDPCEAGDGWGTIGVGGGYGFSGPRVTRAGLRGTSVKAAPSCGAQIPLVLADAGAPAARVVEVMSALPESLLAVTTDGAHAQTLAVSFTFLAGNRAADLPELGFTLSPDGARGSAYRGATEDATTWTWDGKSGGVKEAFEATSSVDALRDLPVRIRLDGELTAGALIGAIATLVDGHATTVAIGEPIDHARAGAASTDGPGVRIGQPTVTGELDPAVIRRYLKRNLMKIKYCYEKELLAAPALEGKVDATWTIKANGTVADAKAAGVSPEVSSCVADVIGGIEFPKPKSGAVKVSSYPFEFRPSGG